jgi:hypothetical protein
LTARGVDPACCARSTSATTEEHDVPTITLATDEYLWFVDQALDEMARIVTELGDDANRRPDLPDANSPVAILTHCLGVLEFWPAYMIVDRPFERDRDAEFHATGAVADLVARTRVARRQLAEDLADAELSAVPRHDPVFPEDVGTPLAASQSGLLIHVLREVTQHLGQMELTRDVLLADRP